MNSWAKVDTWPGQCRAELHWEYWHSLPVHKHCQYPPHAASHPQQPGTQETLHNKSVYERHKVYNVYTAPDRDWELMQHQQHHVTTSPVATYMIVSEGLSLVITCLLFLHSVAKGPWVEILLQQGKLIDWSSNNGSCIAATRAETTSIHCTQHTDIGRKRHTWPCLLFITSMVLMNSLGLNKTRAH